MSSESPGDTLFVVPFNPFIPWSEGTPPFAVVVAAQSGPAIRNKAFPCIAVFEAPEGKFDLADGVFGVGADSIAIHVDCPWPELCKALSEPPRWYSPLLKTFKHEPPYLRVKNWAEDGYLPERFNRAAEGRAVRAFRVLSHWNKWNARPPVPWRDRLEDIFGAKFLADKDVEWLDKQSEVLRKDCEEIGLQNGKMTDFDHPWSRLQFSLGLAASVVQELVKTKRTRQKA